MTLEEFKSSLSKGSPPEGIGELLKALWYDAKGDWEKAHEIAQEDSSSAAAHVHAYLHRKEGDISNARYWYSTAGKDLPGSTLEEEWEEIVLNLLDL